jgi:hypothetical protein
VCGLQHSALTGAPAAAPPAVLQLQSLHGDPLTPICMPRDVP